MQSKFMGVVFCCSLLAAAGCVDTSNELELDGDAISEADLDLLESEQVESEQVESEQVESEQVESEQLDAELLDPDSASDLTWYCEGWYGPWYQYCLTRCEYNSTLHSVGSESTIAFGECNAAADRHCRNRGWGAHYGACWGYFY